MPHEEPEKPPNTPHEVRGFGAKINSLIESERILREGPTLKNASDNLRSLTVLVAMAVAVVALLTNDKTGNPLITVTGILWGAWIAWYTLLAVAQAGMLSMIAITDSVVGSWLESKPQRVTDALIYLLACLSLCFTLGTLMVLLSTFKLLARHP